MAQRFPSQGNLRPTPCLLASVFVTGGDAKRGCGREGGVLTHGGGCPTAVVSCQGKGLVERAVLGK